MDEEQRLAPPDRHATCPNATKWSERISTESDAERDYEKQGKKRENSKPTKDDKHEDKESDDNNTDAGTSQLTQTTSPKRTKKIKVDRNVLTARERTRSQSGLKMPYQSYQYCCKASILQIYICYTIQNRNSKHK